MRLALILNDPPNDTGSAPLTQAKSVQAPKR